MKIMKTEYSIEIMRKLRRLATTPTKKEYDISYFDFPVSECAGIIVRRSNFKLFIFVVDYDGYLMFNSYFKIKALKSLPFEILEVYRRLSNIKNGRSENNDE